jgi:hypothetical protein
MRCPRRSISSDVYGYPAEDHWRDNGTCSYCGSITPKAFFEAIQEGKEIEPTDKSYKVYVKTTQFAKFYFQHLSNEDQDKFIKLVNDKQIKIGFPGYFYTTPYFCQKIEK